MGLLRNHKESPRFWSLAFGMLAVAMLGLGLAIPPSARALNCDQASAGESSIPNDDATPTPPPESWPFRVVLPLVMNHQEQFVLDRFSLGGETWLYSWPNDNLMVMEKLRGQSIHAFPISWAEAEPTLCNFDEAVIANWVVQIKEMLQHGNVILSVKNTPEFARFYDNLVCTQGNLEYADRYVAFVTKVMLDLKAEGVDLSRIIWELGNEVEASPLEVTEELAFYIGCGGPNELDPSYAERFAAGEAWGEFLATVIPQIKAAVPQAKIAIGGFILSSPDKDGVFVKGVAARLQERGIVVEYVSGHFYFYATGEGDPRSIYPSPVWGDRAEDAVLGRSTFLAEAFPGATQLVTEFGVLDHRWVEGLPELPELEQKQADAIAKIIMLFFEEDLHASFFAPRDPGWMRTYLYKGENWRRAADVYGYMLQVLQPYIDEFRRVEPEFAQTILLEDDDLVGKKVTKGESTLTVWYTESGMAQTLVLPGTTTLVTDSTGQVLDVQPGDSITITASPILVFEDKQQLFNTKPWVLSQDEGLTPIEVEVGIDAEIIEAQTPNIKGDPENWVDWAYDYAAEQGIELGGDE